MKTKNMIRIVPASQAKNNFGQVIKRVYELEETQIIERAGLPVAAIVPVSDLERLYPERLKKLTRVSSSARRQRAWRALMLVLEESQRSGEGYSEEEVEEDVARAVAEVRHGKPRRNHRKTKGLAERK